jgi:hypothetical protein
LCQYISSVYSKTRYKTKTYEQNTEYSKYQDIDKYIHLKIHLNTHINTHKSIRIFLFNNNNNNVYIFYLFYILISFTLQIKYLQRIVKVVS